MSGRGYPINQPGAAGGFQFNVFNVGASNSGIQIGPNNVMNVPPPQQQQQRPRRSERAKRPQKPLSQSEREPSMQQMDNISQKIDKYKEGAWKELGERLGLSTGELETVEHDFHRNGREETCYQMLRRWKERQPTPPQIKVLAKALCDIGRGDLSDSLY